MRRMMILTAIALVAACGGDVEPDVTSTSVALTTTSDATAASTSTSLPVATTMGPTTTTTTRVEEVPEQDLLTAAAGVVIVSFEGEPPSNFASTAIRAIDGAHNQIGFSADTNPPAVYVFEMPAETTFERFLVPDVTNTPGNATFFGSVEIEGSNTSATDGYEVLVSADFEELPEDEESVEFTPDSQTAVRWIRLTLSGALVLDPAHEPGKTTVRFTELIGYGTQEDVDLEQGFDGVWNLRYADNPDGSGDLTQLKQDGATVVGCIGHADVSGTVTGNVLRLNGIDRRDERPSVYLLTLNAEGELQGVESTNNSVFRARVSSSLDASTETPCSEVQLQPLACGSIVYINFDVNSDVIRADSAAVLDDLAAGLTALDGGMATIEGHTSTEGTEEHNLDLSERRAAAVVVELVTRGVPVEQLDSVGKGETEPLVSESDEASRSINRRVEVVCGSG